MNIDPAKVWALVSKLAKDESVELSDSGCNTGLFGYGWYIVEYTVQYANVAGFDEFVAHKARLLIVIGIGKCELPNGQSILLWHKLNEGVYNKGVGLLFYPSSSFGLGDASSTALTRAITGRTTRGGLNGSRLLMMMMGLLMSSLCSYAMPHDLQDLHA
jgi:hypothetical protein